EPDKVGPEDCRLRPDSPGYRAGKDGKDLGADVDLVGPGAAYEKWKQTPEYQQWLKDTGQLKAHAEPRPEPGRFVLLAGRGGAAQKVEALAEGVQRAADGDTIEIRGNGPFPTRSVRIEPRLVIRAAAGFRPVIRFRREQSDKQELLHLNAPCTLEGLDFENDRARPEAASNVVICAGPSLAVTNCRFHLPDYILVWSGGDTSRCWFKNCEILSMNGLDGHLATGGAKWLDNGVMLSRSGLGNHFNPQAGEATARITRTTLVTDGFGAGICPEMKRAKGPRLLKVEMAKNIFASGAVVGINNWVPPGDDRGLAADERVAFVQERVQFQGEQNLFSLRPTVGEIAFLIVHDGRWLAKLKTLDSWKKYSGSAETGSLEGQARFKGGQLFARYADDPRKLTPDDFRLPAHSPGDRPAKDGKDLGADVDLVGPGAAYEKWKNMPEYQQWLKDTGQKK